MTISILVADDHPLVRDGIRFSIEHSGADIRIAAEAANGYEALDRAREIPIDVFILDVTMPRLNGLDTARELIRTRPSARIVILSFHDSKAIVEQAMDIGVRGYLTKESAAANVVECIQRVHEGNYYLCPDVAYVVVEKALKGSERTRGTAGSDLTLKERKVLQLIAEGRTTKEIAVDMGLSTNTVHVHRKNLMSKLDIHKETQLVRFAIREGIVQP